MNPALQVINYSYTYPAGGSPSLCDASLSIHEGECVCVTGPSGCGKTTLLMAVQGLLKSGHTSGTVSLRKNGWKLGVGMVFQNADTQILCTTVEDEVAFGTENLGFFSRDRVQDALRAVGLTDFAKRNVERLSAGEKHRLTIASAISMEPGLLLLDEPTGQLDADGKRKLLEILKRLKERGHALLITDHNYNLFRFIADRYVFMKSGHIVSEICDADTPSLSDMVGQKTAPGIDAPSAIAVDNLHLSGTNGTDVFDGVNMSITRGEIVHLFGQNGAGKSTLLKCIAGLVSPDSGTIQVSGIGTPKPDKLLGKMGFLFQNPQRQIFEDTVYEEVAFSLKRMGLSKEEIRNRVIETLALCDVSDLSERPPLTLSFGEQHRVALASVIAPGPGVLLLDEPFAGLDLAQRYRILRILSELRQRRGTTVLVASHDLLPDPHWADRILNLQGGRIETL
ncbi:MAG: ATP-binding cassette domain-containing protein [Nitrospirota bacterium]